MSHILALDQGTTSSRAILFDRAMAPVAMAQREIPQHFPRSGWVEHDPEDMWASTVDSAREALARAGLGAADVAAVGLTNQRETTLIWERATGRTLHRAIVWQDRRTAETCVRLRDDGHGPMIAAKTGLLIDPYFSATKLAWLLDHVEGARARAARGEILFGTVDSYLVWRLTGGALHATDATNAARTMLYDIHTGRWSDEICALFGIPPAMLPEVRDCAADFGMTEAGIFGRPLPILGVAGDQQAATMGQACFAPGMVKATYGTGCFALMNTGAKAVASRTRLLTTIAYQFDGAPTYALEGAIFVAGAVVQWLRDGLGLITTASEASALAERADPGQDVYLVPAFTGLGAPYWDAEARGAMFGLTRATGPAEIARASLESIGYQSRDLIEAMAAEVAGAGGLPASTLRVDGGMSASDWTMQFVADMLDAPVDRPRNLETTALGAAWLAGMRAGIYPDRDGFAATWTAERRFTPRMDAAMRARKYAGWRDAVARVASGAT